MASVLQNWVGNVGMKMQSILLSGLRAPDHKTTAVKRSIRWLRAQCQHDADPGKKSYMQPIDMNAQLVKDAIAELEYCTCHFTHHFADAFAVVAYHHPNKWVRDMACAMHFLIAEEIFHFVPETKEQFVLRHADKPLAATAI